MSPKFSIIVPLYNKAPYVRKALQSVCNQTYADWECLIIDDGSTDGSADVVRDYIRALNGENGENGEEWKALFDWLRVNGLMEYWMSDEYNEAAAKELDKVDWSKQPRKMLKKYKQPIWVLRYKRRFMQIGSYCKQNLLRMITKIK